MGDIDKAQETLSVGVGALAGSTIMLLTVPWSLCIFAGRVDMRYSDGGDTKLAYHSKPKLTPDKDIQSHLLKTGVGITKETRHGGLIMILTTIPYFIIQGPAFFLHGPSEDVAKGERWWAFLGLATCVIGFISYLAVNVQASKRDEEKLKRLEVMKDLLRKGSVSLSGAFTDLIKTYGYQHETDGEYNTFLGNGFLRPSPKVKEYLASVLEDSFLKYDKDRSSTLQKAEVSSFFLLLYF